MPENPDIALMQQTVLMQFVLNKSFNPLWENVRDILQFSISALYLGPTFGPMNPT